MTDLRDLERTKQRSIIGRIWFTLGEQAFPGAGWSDFIVVVLGWWIGQLLDLRRANKSDVEFLFMDGPYSILVKEDRDGALALSFRKGSDPAPRMPPVTWTTRHELETELLTNAREVVAACRSEEWPDDVEVQKLARLVHDLETNSGLPED